MIICPYCKSWQMVKEIEQDDKDYMKTRGFKKYDCTQQGCKPFYIKIDDGLGPDREFTKDIFVKLKR